MPSYRFDHIHLNSANPLKTAEFYEKTLGAKRLRIGELAGGRTSIILDLSGVEIVITHPRAGPAPFMTDYGLDHFGLITDDLETAVGELKARGVKFIQEITELRPGTKISFFLAPENVWVELMEKQADHNQTKRSQ